MIKEIKLKSLAISNKPLVAMSQRFQAKASDSCSVGDKCWALNKAVMITSSSSIFLSRSPVHRYMVICNEN